MRELINTLLLTIKEKNPLILNITNSVSMDIKANGLLALGAAPVMSNSIEEIEDLLTIADGVVINIGTLNSDFIALCFETCRLANQMQKPITFDPVGAGASRVRTNACCELLQTFDIAIIRGNASEIMALCGQTHNTKGVNSKSTTTDALASARLLASQFNAIVTISGAEDAIVSLDQECVFSRGSALMPMLTGSGCLLTAVISCFHAVHHDPFTAAKAATLFYSICGEIAAEKADGPGSFKPLFLDALSHPFENTRL